MTLKSFFVLLFISLVNGNYDFQVIDSIKQEQPCIMSGGMCTIATDCPLGRLSNVRGLCPLQRNRGIECCYGLSIRETRCEKRGGACFASNQYCNPILIYKQATNCPFGSKCCILVR